MLIAVDGVAVRKAVKQIAVDIHGAKKVAERGWYPDSDLRAQVRRLVEKARELMKGDYLELAAGRRPRL